MTAADTLLALAGELGLTAEAEYVPHAYKRPVNRNELQLKWDAKLLRNGRVILESPFMSGCARCHP